MFPKVVSFVDFSIFEQIKRCQFSEDLFLHEGFKTKQKHENILKSIMNLKEKYLPQFDYSKMKGFIQYFSMQSFVLGLWTQKDIDMFHYNAKQYRLMGDFTGSIATEEGTKIILYFSFLMCGKTKNIEPLANIEILAYSHDAFPIRYCLAQFILDEKRKFGHNFYTVPVPFTCDMSWPILKFSVRCFNNESVEE